MGRVLRLGPRALAGAGPRRGRPLDHVGGDRDRDRADPARPARHAARPAPTGQGRQGDRDARPPQRRPPDLGGRPRQRPLRQRVHDHRRAGRRPAARRDARRVPRDPHRRLVGRARPPSRPALHRRRHAVPAPARPTADRADLGRRLPRQAAAAATRRPPPGLLPREPRPPRPARGDRDRPRRAAGRGGPAPRRAAADYDLVAAVPPGTDPAPWAAAGATWLLVEFPWEAVTADQLRAVVHAGPAV